MRHWILTKDEDVTGKFVQPQKPEIEGHVAEEVNDVREFDVDYWFDE